MRICFVPENFDGAGFYRCLFPARELSARGHEAKVPPHKAYEAKENGRILIHWEQVERIWPAIAAEVYVFHRQMERAIPELMAGLQSQGAIVVADTDDDDLGVPAYNPAFEGAHPKLNPARNRDHLIRGYRQADVVTVSTPFLAERVSRFNSNVHLLPNYLDWRMWEDVTPAYELERPRLRVGWMGDGKWRGGDLAVLQGVIVPWLERNPHVDFVAAGDPGVHDLLGIPEGQRVSYERVDFRTMTLPEITATMDVGLVPLEPNGFNEAKSALKGMEYAACGIPCIATPTESYRDWVEEGETGFLAARPRDWIRALDELCGPGSDGSLRRELGRGARRKAAEHTIQGRVERWEALYSSLTGGTRGLARAAMANGAVQKHAEFKGLLELLEGRKLQTVVEIGTAAGGAFYALARASAPDALLVSIDLPGADGYDYGGTVSTERLRELALPGQQTVFIGADSHAPETLEQLREVLGRREIDLLFIDGDHGYEGVKADFEAYAPLCTGLVAFHDIVKHPRLDPPCEVDQLWNEIKGDYAHEELIEQQWGQWGGIGVLYLDREERKAA